MLITTPCNTCLYAPTYLTLTLHWHEFDIFSGSSFLLFFLWFSSGCHLLLLRDEDHEKIGCKWGYLVLLLHSHRPRREAPLQRTRGKFVVRKHEFWTVSCQISRKSVAKRPNNIIILKNCKLFEQLWRSEAQKFHRLSKTGNLVCFWGFFWEYLNNNWTEKFNFLTDIAWNWQEKILCKKIGKFICQISRTSTSVTRNGGVTRSGEWL